MAANTTADNGAKPNADFDTESLAHWMGDMLGLDAGSLVADKFPGGQSNPTYRVSAGGDRKSVV